MKKKLKLEDYKWDTSKFVKLDSGVKRCPECGRLKKIKNSLDKK